MRMHGSTRGRQQAGRRRLTCHHEAGHALVRWYFGHRTDRAVVLTVDEVRAGAKIENRRGGLVACEGIVDGYDIHGAPWGPLPIAGTREDQDRLAHLRAVDRDVELMNCAAGIAAEAAYRKASAFACALWGGEGDLRTSGQILDAWYADPLESREAALAAERRAVALVRSRPGAAAIRTMADALMQAGEIDGDEIASICREAYGGRECPFGAWAKHWPPTLAQIRGGFIPERVAA